MQVLSYGEENRAECDAFVDQARNATFLFRRGYLEYHAARFPDASLLVRDDAGELVGLPPASASGDLISSHPGLTYGGLVSGEWMTAVRTLEALTAIAESLDKRGFSGLAYKTVPHIYHRVPAEEDRYLDLGAATDAGGLQLNEGLAAQKEGFGARSVVHDHYELGL